MSIPYVSICPDSEWTSSTFVLVLVASDDGMVWDEGFRLLSEGAHHQLPTVGGYQFSSKTLPPVEGGVGRNLKPQFSPTVISVQKVSWGVG